tara:strand:- start:672 stop:881 length:210 start_codon:yes stop_codon:yes gene_type:complete
MILDKGMSVLEPVHIALCFVCISEEIRTPVEKMNKEKNIIANFNLVSIILLDIDIKLTIRVPIPANRMV